MKIILIFSGPRIDDLNNPPPIDNNCDSDSLSPAADSMLEPGIACVKSERVDESYSEVQTPSPTTLDNAHQNVEDEMQERWSNSVVVFDRLTPSHKPYTTTSSKRPDGDVRKIRVTGVNSYQHDANDIERGNEMDGSKPTLVEGNRVVFYIVLFLSVIKIDCLLSLKC